MSRFRLLLIAVATTFILVVLLLLVFPNPFAQRRLAFVENIRVFNEFTMTKEMKKQGEQELGVIGGQIDQLYQQMAATSDPESKEAIMKAIITEKQRYQAFATEFPDKESEKIWLRIKSYAAAFAEENDIAILLGAHPDMNVIYGDATIDQTNAFIKYINKRYEGN